MLSSKSTEFLLKNQKNLIFAAAVSLILVGFMGYAIYINFSYYWDFLHSDIVADLAFIREAARTFSLFPRGWAHINEMRFIYVTTPAILFYWITRNVHLAYSLAVSLMLVVNVALFYFMVSFKKRNLSVVIVGAIVFLMLFSRYTIFSVFSILFINGTLSTHLATVFLTIGVYLRTKYKEEDTFKGEKVLWGITFVLAFLQGIQSTRMIVSLYAPLIFVELLFVLRRVSGKGVQTNKSGIQFATVAALLNVMGMFLVNMFIDHGLVELEEAGLTFGLNLVSTGLFIERIFESITTLFYTLGLVGGGSLLSMHGLLFVARAGFIFVLVFLYVHLKKDEEEKNMVATLAATVAFSALAQALISMGMGERFNFTATALIGAMFVVVVDHLVERLSASRQGDKDDFYLQKHFTESLVMIAIVGSLLSVSTLGATRNPNLVADRQRVVNFLAAENLTVGYGAFWQGLAITGVSNWEVVVIPFHSNHGVVGQPLRQGVAYHDFFHNEERVFLVGTVSHMEEAYGHYRMGSALQQGQRHDFYGGWVVYVFDHNPWAEFK
ncbi:MAG: hypothetical protein FWE07_01320 [Turicibacter sp.]|nr:hypothetical protein [Turicibacter sp.]